jgi:hypothetical protein
VTIKEELHHLVDALPDADAALLLRDLRDSEDREPLTSEDRDALARGIGDLANGQSISLAELKQKYGL